MSYHFQTRFTAVKNIPFKRKNAALLAVFGAAFTFSTPNFAQNSDANDADKIVVTATRQAVRVNELISDVLVISREKIEKASPQQSLGEFLAKEGGMSFSSSGKPGADGGVFIRGTNSGHTLVLIDGLRVGSATLGSASLGAIPLSQIERIEVLKGAASSLYGADALGGVIQVFTKKGINSPSGTPQFNGEIAYGTDNTKSLSAGVRGQVDSLHYSLQLGGVKSDSFSSIKNRQSSIFNEDNDPYKQTNVSANVSLDLAKGHEVGISLLRSNNISHYDSSYYDAFLEEHANYDFQSDTTIESASVFSKNRILDAWTSSLRLGVTVDDNVNKGSPLRKSDEFKTTQNQFMWQNDIRLPIGSLLLAYENLEQKIEANTRTPFAETSRRISSLLAGFTGNLDKHRFQANIRGDNNSQFGRKNTGSLGYGYQITDDWRIRTAYSTGFKAPTFNDLYYPNSGNADLKPETSKNREIGVNYDTGTAQAALTYYQNEIEDMIQWAPVNGGAWRPQNIAQAKIRGISATAKVRLGAFDIYANADWLDPKNEVTGKIAPNRAKKFGTVGFDYSYGKWQAGAEIASVGMRYNDANNRQELGGYGLLNLRASYKIDQAFSVFAKIDNALNKEYELFRDYQTPKASVFVGVRYQP